MTESLISQKVLKEMAEAGAIRSAVVFGVLGGFHISVHYGMTDRTVAAHRGGARLFRSADAALSMLKKLGIVKNIDVHLADWE